MRFLLLLLALLPLLSGCRCEAESCCTPDPSGDAWCRSQWGESSQCARGGTPGGEMCTNPDGICHDSPTGFCDFFDTVVQPSGACLALSVAVSGHDAEAETGPGPTGVYDALVGESMNVVLGEGLVVETTREQMTLTWPAPTLSGTTFPESVADAFAASWTEHGMTVTLDTRLRPARVESGVFGAAPHRITLRPSAESTIPLEVDGAGWPLLSQFTTPVDAVLEYVPDATAPDVVHDALVGPGTLQVF